MTVPTRGETYSLLLHHIRMAEEQSAMMAHLHNTEGNSKDQLLAKGWLTVSEAFRVMAIKVTSLAKGRLQ
jgi:hypothetical protein